jgi:hypothetical protein
MAKCSSCGRGGFFRKVDEFGLCFDCAIIADLETKRKKLKEKIN